MMNKERELLLYIETLSLLAQPEQEGITQPKHEPLSEDEILEGMKDEPSTSCRCFICGIKFAEKAHGITGADYV
jgi:hypothetical protein